VQSTIPFSPLSFVAIFIGLWCLISLVIAQGGWRQLATEYPATNAPEGRRFLAARGWIEPYIARYNYCLNVIPASAGIYIAVQFPYRFAHRPMLIPWSCVRTVAEHAGWFGQRFLDVTIAVRHFVFTLRLPEDAVLVFQNHAPRLFPNSHPANTHSSEERAA
jgi:hypothetical protein